ncbi:hypothetical protein KIW84_040173 [Lathyrus oleraceus]|uniref:Uncharacterized protein n=1 Tax=Pisum sativum TaxID=3888 RepID=A0A9D4X5F4_PEA|nr:hypothetical protein KIW84_040173 [Pisum sativum]
MKLNEVLSDVRLRIATDVTGCRDFKARQIDRQIVEGDSIASHIHEPEQVASHVPESEPTVSHVHELEPPTSHVPEPEPPTNHVPEPESTTQVSEPDTQAFIEQNIHLNFFYHIEPETLASFLDDEDFRDYVIGTLTSVVLNRNRFDCSLYG